MKAVGLAQEEQTAIFYRGHRDEIFMALSFVSADNIFGPFFVYGKKGKGRGD
ncbi:MAG: hypothetical protein ACREOI_22910 [bacterium]